MGLSLTASHQPDVVKSLSSKEKTTIS